MNREKELEALILSYKGKLEKVLVENNYKIQTTEHVNWDPEEGFKEVKIIVDHYMEHFNISIQRYGEIKTNESE